MYGALSEVCILDVFSLQWWEAFHTCGVDCVIGSLIVDGDGCIIVWWSCLTYRQESVRIARVTLVGLLAFRTWLMTGSC